MTKKRDLTKDWTVFAKKRLVGKKIVSVEYMSNQEIKNIGWHKRPVCLGLDDGSWIYPQMDDEGNDGGVLYYHNEDDSQVFPVLSEGD